MRKLASFIIVSLDGFHETPDGDFDWPIVDDEFNDFAVRQLDEVEALGFGRTTYEHMASYWPTEQTEINDPGITSRMNSKPKFVFSTSLTEAGWSETTIARGDAVAQAQAIKETPGGDLLIIGSAHLTAHLADAGVLDELRIMISPIVIGQGRSLFQDLTRRIPLTLLRTRLFESGNILLTYRPEPEARD